MLYTFGVQVAEFRGLGSRVRGISVGLKGLGASGFKSSRVSGSRVQSSRV